MKHLPHLSELSVPWGPFPQPQTSRSQSVTKEFQSPAVPASLPPPSPLKSQVNQAASTFYLKCQPGSGFPEKKKIHSQKKKLGPQILFLGLFLLLSHNHTYLSLSLSLSSTNLALPVSLWSFFLCSLVLLGRYLSVRQFYNSGHFVHDQRDPSGQ
ncbi:hypothetical protein CABS03_08176 [Colletotrichum abscissum]|uniref:Uncharacterized protein n=1 Tax=Colletotrichum abscissum TaxID=1671311 RepID=A0A9P9XJ87_9PEZI|nr:hypothetical protein CABS02_04914 [Colletotrichum abscissum]